MNYKKKILFYSSVTDMNSFFISSFYVEDIKALKLSGYEVLLTNNIFSFIKFWNYNLSFCYFYKKSLFPALLSLIFFKKVYFTGGIDDLDTNSNTSKINITINEYLFIFCYILSTKCNIVSQSDFNRVSGILDSFFISKTKLSLHPHSIDISYYIDQSKFTNKSKFTFITICWLGTMGNIQRKGVDRSIHIMSFLIKHIPDLKFIIIGQLGNGSVGLQDLIIKLKLEKNVFLTGAISDLEKSEYLCKSKYYLQLSKYEGFGLAVLEAMAAKCIIFHSNVGGLKDTIGNNGIILDNNLNYNNCSDIINSIINSTQNYTNNLEVNRDKVFSLYNINSRTLYFKKLLNS